MGLTSLFIFPLFSNLKFLLAFLIVEQDRFSDWQRFASEFNAACNDFVNSKNSYVILETELLS